MPDIYLHQEILFEVRNAGAPRYTEKDARSSWTVYRLSPRVDFPSDSVSFTGNETVVKSWRTSIGYLNNAHTEERVNLAMNEPNAFWLKGTEIMVLRNKLAYLARRNFSTSSLIQRRS